MMSNTDGKRYVYGRFNDFVRKFRRKNPDVQLKGGPVRLNVPLSISDVPPTIREGLAPADRSPTYTSDPGILRGIYHGYDGSFAVRYGLLYEDITLLHTANTHGIERDAIDVSGIKIVLENTRYKIPQDLTKNFDEVIHYFKESNRLNWDPKTNTYENNRTARIQGFDKASATFTLKEARYFDQLATNAVMDTATGFLPAGKETIRKDIDPPIEGKLPPLEKSLCANTLGVAAIIYDKDFGEPFLRLRSKNMATITEGGLHCTVSGVYETPDVIKKGDSGGFGILEHGIRLEIKNELNINEEDMDLFPVAFARELPRGGKPQLFFVARVKMTKEELIEKAKSAKERHEFLSSDDTFFETAETKDGSSLFTYEGWAALVFAEEFIEANEFRQTESDFSTFS